MKAIINRFMFSQVNFDSSSLTVLSSIIHKFSEPGEYHATILRGSDIVGRFSLIVCEPTTSTAPSCNEQSAQAKVSDKFKQQINVDLKRLDLPVAQHLESQACNCFMLKPGGYAVFYVSTGVGGYALEIRKIGSKCGPAKVFDSRELNCNDLFTAIVLRPGTYSITNVDTNAKGELTVAYPEIGKIPKNPKPVPIECTENSMNPNVIRINPTQGLIFSFKTPSRIKIELTKPEDRPKITPAEKLDNQEQIRPTATTAKKKIKRRIKINPRGTIQS